ncbi:MAG: hypothetical protein ACRDHF_14630, partial [Tepidiformaceae bacterium]
ICWAVSFRGWVAQLAEDLDTVNLHAEETHALAVRHGFRYFEAVGLIFRGWCATAGGADPELAQIAAGIAVYDSIGAESALSYFEAMRAQAALLVGRPVEAADFVRRGLAVATKNGERTFLPELHRLAGEAASALGAEQTEVAAHLERGLTAAREIGAPAPGLRVALSAVRLLGDTPVRAEAIAGLLEKFAAGAESDDIVVARSHVGARV